MDTVNLTPNPSPLPPYDPSPQNHMPLEYHNPLQHQLETEQNGSNDGKPSKNGQYVVNNNTSHPQISKPLLSENRLTRSSTDTVKDQFGDKEKTMSKCYCQSRWDFPSFSKKGVGC
ncbi:branchpoint-bridging protein [Spatholobus suberectus]|nr:branchpoint-bridging protein [Spatholobus suberectus]